MKTIKTFRYNEIFVYGRYGERLAGRLQDLFEEDHVIHAFYSGSTGSTRGEGASAIFFDEDILNLPEQIWYFNSSWGPDLPMQFILVPIEYNGQQYEAWVTLNKFNFIFTQTDREELQRVLPKYFSDKPEKKLGFFTEDNNIDEEYEEIHVNSGQSWKVKTRGENCYKVKILLPTRTNRFNTFRWSVVHQTPGGLGAGYQEACFLTQQEAEEFIQRHNLDEEYPSRYGEWYAYPARVDLNLIKVPLESGEEIHIRTECLPRTTTWGGEDDPAGIEWWEKVRRLFPRYFSEQPVRRLGFFTESINTNFSSDEIISIMKDTNLDGEQKCRRLFNRSEDYISHVQWLCYSSYERFINYLVEHNYITDNMRQMYNDSPGDFYDTIEEAASQAETYNNNSGKRTLFLDDETGDTGPCSLEASWNYYVEDNNCNGATESNRAFNWYEHIKNSVSYMEEKNITQDWKTQKRLGFFSN